MAYEIISQNNTTTTLSDGVNVIRVPARVVLATSTTYTVTKVNNNIATLEDGNGKVYKDIPCVAVLYGGSGGGGSDPHNLGWYADLAALQAAHATGENGDFAILGSTDTVWVWDSGTSAWKDTDTKGQVTSVNNRTGAVTVSEVPDQTGQSGKFLTTDGTNPSWATVGGLPSQTGQSGKFLTTDGTDPSWATINALENTATGSNALTILGTPASSWSAINIGNSSVSSAGGTVTIGDSAQTTAAGAVAVGRSAKATDGTSVAIGNYAKAVGTSPSVSVGHEAGSYNSIPNNVGCTCIGAYAMAKAPYGLVLNASDNIVYNTEPGTFVVGLRHNNSSVGYTLMSSDGTIPVDRLASTTGLADGNYRLRLTMASGVPTLSWVAE